MNTPPTALQNFWIKHIAIASIIAVLLYTLHGSDNKPQIATPVFVDIHQQSHTLNEWQGKLLVLNFWASWCQPCKEEMPILNAFQQAYANTNIQVIGIAVDEVETIQDYIKNNSVDYPVLIGQDPAITLAVQLGNQRQGLPFTVIIHPNGKVLNRHLGALNKHQLADLIAPYLPITAIKG